MEKYLFIYSVDTMTTAGVMQSELMLIDHDDVFTSIRNAIESGQTVLSVRVSMYDDSGNYIAEKEINFKPGFPSVAGNGKENESTNNDK